MNNEKKCQVSVKIGHKRADDTSMRSKQQGGAEVAREVRTAIRCEKSKETDAINKTVSDENITKEQSDRVNTENIVNKLNKDINIDIVRESESDSEINRIEQERLTMNRQTYEYECERRKSLINQEKKLRKDYKERIQQMQQIVEENNKIESRCRTLQSLIKEIPTMQETNAERNEKSFIEEVQLIKQLTNPAVIFTDKINVTTPNENYEVSAEVVGTVEKLNQENKEQPIKPFRITYTIY